MDVAYFLLGIAFFAITGGMMRLFGRLSGA